MTCFVGLDVSQKMPEQISVLIRRHAGDDARIGIETGAMTPWLVHELRNLGFEVICLDARHARAALEMQINKTDQNDAEGLAQIVRTGWYRSVHVKSFDSHRARARAPRLVWESLTQTRRRQGNNLAYDAGLVMVTAGEAGPARRLAIEFVAGAHTTFPCRARDCA
jgi:transposase